MHVEGFLHKLLSSVIHKKRLVTLTYLAMGLLRDKNLSVTGLGRSINLPIQERSGVKRADRFIGNHHLHNELKNIYSKPIEILIGNKSRPKIIVDWTHVPNTTHYVLRAALATKGRAITLYEEAYKKKKLSNARIEKKFLITLRSMLPAECRPIIITDAGFRNPWFKQVLKIGWDYIGRIRGVHKYFNGTQWIACKNLLLKAELKVKYIGNVSLCKKNELLTHLFLYKEKSKKRTVKKKYRRNQGGNDHKHYVKSAKEPWLLASSLSGHNWLRADRVIKLYKKRMQIEESFRDIKCVKYGFGLRRAHSRDVKRISIQFMIAMIASFIAWLVGLIAEENNWHYHFQTPSIKHRRVLSLCYLGCQVIKRNIKLAQLNLADILQKVSGFAV